MHRNPRLLHVVRTYSVGNSLFLTPSLVNSSFCYGFPTGIIFDMPGALFIMNSLLFSVMRYCNERGWCRRSRTMVSNIPPQQRERKAEINWWYRSMCEQSVNPSEFCLPQKNPVFSPFFVRLSGYYDIQLFLCFSLVCFSASNHLSRTDKSQCI